MFEAIVPCQRDNTVQVSRVRHIKHGLIVCLLGGLLIFVEISVYSVTKLNFE